MIYGITLTDERLLQQYNLWSVGALGGRGRTELEAVVPFIALGAVAAILLARPLNALALGDDSARSLGAQVGRTRIGGAVAITLLCGAATAAAGPIYFLGLTVPHAARAICGPDQRWVLAYSAVLGAALLLVADVLGRVLVRPSELQAGLMLAVVGAPLFIALVRRQADRGALMAFASVRRTPLPGRVVRVGAGVSLRLRSRALVVAAVLLVLVLALLVVAVGTGEFPIAPGDVAAALLGGGDQGTAFIVRELRLPRAVCAVLVGAALGISGAVFQSLTRNPLGSPDIVGFQQGASVGALIVITVIGGSGAAVSLGALAGGAVTALAVYVLAFKRGGTSGYRLILVGIAIAALMLALIDYLLSRARIEDAQEATRWLLGSLNNRSWDDVVPLAVVARPAAARRRGGRAGAARARARRRRRLRARRAGGARAASGLVGLAVALVSITTVAVGPIVLRRAHRAADRAPARPHRPRRRSRARRSPARRSCSPPTSRRSGSCRARRCPSAS